MNSIERIHPELNPEDIPPSTASEEEIEEMKIKGGKIVPITKKERKRLQEQKLWRKRTTHPTEHLNISESDREKIKECDALKKEYSCGIDLKPRWCVWGRGFKDDAGVLSWIKPSPEDEFVARRIARLITELGGEARAEKTEWNKTFGGKAVYKDNAVLDL